MDNPAELETQKQVYTLIIKEPGLHVNKIADLLKISVPLLLYHLHFLEKNELITVIREEGFTRCYAKGKIGSEDKKMLSLLRQEMLLKIILYLLKNPYSKHKDILENFHVAKSTLSYHLKKLVKYQIICVQTVGNEEGYAVINEQEMIRCLIRYKPSRVIVGLKDTWTDFTVR